MVNRKQLIKWFNLGGVFSFGVIFQMIFNLPNRPWYDNGHIYRGDRVVVKKNTTLTEFYSSCEYATVLYVHQEKVDRDAVILWKCPKHPSDIMRSGPIDLIGSEALELKK